ncbi:uncharacterized protein LOC144737044 [Lampetra planeri]
MAAPSDDWVESSDSSDGEEPAMDSGTDVDQAPKVTCLFCDQTFGSSDETLLHCSTAHDFHLLHSLKANGLDFYDYIRIVNFIRNTGPSPRDLLFSPRESQPWVSDRFLTSTLEDDLLLTHGEWTSRSTLDRSTHSLKRLRKAGAPRWLGDVNYLAWCAGGRGFDPNPDVCCCIFGVCVSYPIPYPAAPGSQTGTRYPYPTRTRSTLEGTISCRKQRKDRRSLDIVLTIGSVRARYSMQ